MLARQFALTTLAYTVVGLIALQLALPPSYAAPVYPSAGIALAAAYVHGWRMLPAAALGSWLVNLLGRVAYGDVSTVDLTLPLFTALGAALQAGVGVWLLRRFIGPTLRLETPQGFLRFAILGGLVACLTSASIATAAFWVAGTVPAADLMSTWWNWWTGDAIGVLIAVPITLAFIGAPREVWAPRRWSVALPLAIVTLMVSSAIALIGRWERENIDQIFADQAAALSAKVQAAFVDHLRALHAARAVVLAAPELSAQDFDRATAYWLHAIPSLQAVGWSRYVTDAQRDSFEAALSEQLGRRVTLLDVASDGSRAPTPRGHGAMAITYIEPRARNATALGVNTLSMAAPARAMRNAAATGEASATAGFRLAQEVGQQTGVVVYLPVPSSTLDAAAIDPALPKPIRGVVFVTMRMDDALKAARGNAHAALEVCLLDRSDHATRSLAGAEHCKNPNDARGRLLPIEWQFAGRTWLLQVAGGPTFEAAHRDWSTWFFAATALLTTGLLGGFLLLVSGRAERIQELVDQRTKELRAEVAQREAKEDALVKAERRFSDVFEAAPIGLAYTDLPGRLVRVNGRFCEIAGRPASALIGKRIADISPHEDQSAHAQIVRQLVELGRAHVSIQMVYLRPDGSQVPVEVVNSLSRDIAGAPLHVVKVVEDLTERERRERAEASNRAKTEFLSRMSHELRTPLNAMLGHAQLLQLDSIAPLPHAQLDRVVQIQRAGWHLLEMINDVLDLSRIEAGGVRLSIEPQDLQLLVRDSISMHAALLESRHLTLAVDLADDARFVHADATRLRQVLSNLLSNAIKYNRANGRIALRSQRGEADTVVIQVSDTGIGMDAMQLGHLFEPFNRLGRERTDTEGNGIGLVIARQLLELMDGRIEVESRAGAGTTFSIALPAAAAPSIHSGALSAAPAAESPRPPHRHVLYIEDNPINAELMGAMLGLLPAPVDLHVCTTGEDGLRHLRAQAIDLLLLDLNLPRIGGLDVLRTLRADPRHRTLPVIVVSADALSDQVQAALNAGADAYLTKPVEFSDLVKALHRFGFGAPQTAAAERPLATA